MTRRGAVVAVLLVGLVAALACHLNQDQARIRVKAMLERWQAGGTGTGGDAQSAAMLYYTGHEGAADETIVAIASDHFDSWRKEKDLYKSISSYEIKSVEPDPTTSDATKVTVVIEGNTYGLLVIPGQPIQWKD
jgi:hypothetical protein